MGVITSTIISGLCGPTTNLPLSRWSYSRQWLSYPRILCATCGYSYNSSCFGPTARIGCTYSFASWETYFQFSSSIFVLSYCDILGAQQPLMTNGSTNGFLVWVRRHQGTHQHTCSRENILPHNVRSHTPYGLCMSFHAHTGCPNPRTVDNCKFVYVDPHDLGNAWLMKKYSLEIHTKRLALL